MARVPVRPLLCRTNASRFLFPKRITRRLRTYSVECPGNWTNITNRTYPASPGIIRCKPAAPANSLGRHYAVCLSVPCTRGLNSNIDVPLETG